MIDHAIGATGVEKVVTVMRAVLFKRSFHPQATLPILGGGVEWNIQSLDAAKR
jgi:hypothetical protein